MYCYTCQKVVISNLFIFWKGRRQKTEECAMFNCAHPAHGQNVNLIRTEKRIRTFGTRTSLARKMKCAWNMKSEIRSLSFLVRVDDVRYCISYKFETTDFLELFQAKKSFSLASSIFLSVKFIFFSPFTTLDPLYLMKNWRKFASVNPNFYYTLITSFT